MVIGLTLLAFVLRLATMRDSLLGDELFMFNIVHGRSLGAALHIVRETEKTPPLVFILDWLTSRLGDPTYWVRLPSLLFGTALVPLAYLLGVRSFGRAAGVMAAAMIALSGFGIFYGVEDRAYAGVAFFSALSTLLLLKALDDDWTGWWAGYGLAALAAIYTHYVAFFVVVVQLVWALWTHRERLRTLLIVYGVVILAYLPWLPSFLLQEKHSADEARRIADLAPASLSRFGLINAQDLFGHPFSYPSQIPGTVEVAVAIAVVVLAAAWGAGRVVRERSWPGLSSPRVLIGLLAVAAPAGVLLVSVRPGMSFMIARNLSSSYVLAMVLMAGVVTTLRRPLAAGTAIVVVGVMALGAVNALKPSFRRTPFRLVAHYIDAHSPPSDPVIQEFFIDQNGPLGTVIAINLSHRRSVYTTPAGIARAWQRGQHGENVFVALDLPGVFKGIKQLPFRTGPGKRFVRVREQRYVGLDAVIVAEYRYAPAG